LTREEDDGEEEKKMNCLSKEKENYGVIYERERRKNSMPTAKAGAQCRVPVPNPPPHHGGRRGRWGQARLMGAGEANGGGKPPASCPSPPAPSTREATGPNP